MSTTIKHEQFILEGDYRTGVMTLAKAAANIPAYTILGKQTKDGDITRKVGDVAPAGAGAEGANSGNGTLVKDATAPVDAGAMAGNYLVKCLVKAASPALAKFEVVRPDGALLGVIDVADGSGTAWDRQIKFVITEGSTVFEVGDAFIVPVEITQAAASGNLIPWDPASTDGSEVPYAILVDGAPKNTSATQKVSVFLAGTFNADKAIVPVTTTVKAAFDALREKGIYLIPQADLGKNPVFGS